MKLIVSKTCHYYLYHLSLNVKLLKMASKRNVNVTFTVLCLPLCEYSCNDMYVCMYEWKLATRDKRVWGKDLITLQYLQFHFALFFPLCSLLVVKKMRIAMEGCVDLPASWHGAATHIQLQLQRRSHVDWDRHGLQDHRVYGGVGGEDRRGTVYF